MLEVFKTDKEQHLHSVSASRDFETFLTADESRINMFHLERKQSSIYSLIDYERKSTTFDDERITSMTNNHYNGNMFLYTTSSGKINICDLRERSDFHARATLTLDCCSKSSKLSSDVFKKWVCNVSEAKFV